MNNCKSIQTGSMTDLDIRTAIDEGHIYISPFSEKNLTGVGYNLSVAELLISTSTGLPLKVNEQGCEKYVIIEPHDTVLVLTNESVFVDEHILGTFHSRVKVVSQGFGHISTTLDPLWEGPLLIALTNLSNKAKKFIIAKENGATNIVTLIFNKLNQASQKKHDNPHHRVDILKQYIKTPTGIKKLMLGKSFNQYKTIIGKLMNPSMCNYDDMRLNFLEKTRCCLNKIQRDLLNSNKVMDDNYQLLHSTIIQADVCINKLIVEMLIKLKQDIMSLNNFSSEKDVSLFNPYITIILKSIEKEVKHIKWEKSYIESVELAQDNSFINWRMRFLIKMSLKELLKSCFFFVFWIIFLWFLITFLMNDSNILNIFEMSPAEIWVQLLDNTNYLVMTILATVASALFIRRYVDKTK